MCKWCCLTHKLYIDVLQTFIQFVIASASFNSYNEHYIYGVNKSKSKMSSIMHLSI